MKRSNHPNSSHTHSSFKCILWNDSIFFSFQFEGIPNVFTFMCDFVWQTFMSTFHSVWFDIFFLSFDFVLLPFCIHSCVCVSLFERHNFSEIFIVRHKYKMQLNVRDSTKSSICEHILFRILCEWNQWRKIKEAQTLTLTHISRNWLTATDDTCHNNATVVQKYTNGILFVA